MQTASQDLKEPNGRRVTYTQIPCRPDSGAVIDRNRGNAPFALSLGDLLAPISADDGRLEVALVFLRVLLGAHQLAGAIQLFISHQLGIACPQHQREPIGIVLGYLPELVEVVVSFRR